MEMMNEIKKVYGFIDMFDDIPVGAKYLFSKEFNLPMEETEEQKSARIITGQELSSEFIIYKHYYELSDEDFKKVAARDKELVDFSGKLKAFDKKYNSKK